MYRTSYTQAGVRKIKVLKVSEIYYIAEIYENVWFSTVICSTFFSLRR